ncbi:hypothetical protein AWENTII_012183 [Aspergillus wentii]
MSPMKDIVRTDCAIDRPRERLRRLFNKPENLVRSDRTKRIRDAKSEAQKEIEEYKSQKEEEFKKFEAEHSSGYKKAEEDANKEAEVKLEEIKDAGNKQGDKVVDGLLHALVDVKPEPSAKIVIKT